MSALWRLAIRFLVGTMSRLKRVPTRTIHFLRWLMSPVFTDLSKENAYYASLRELDGHPVSLDHVAEVIVPFLIARNAQLKREVARVEARMLVLYLIMGVALAISAYLGQNLIGTMREAARVNCITTRNLVVTSGADGSPTLTGELQRQYRLQIEGEMSPMRRARVESIKREIERSGFLIAAPDCDKVVDHPETIKPVTIPRASPEQPASRRLQRPAGRP